MSEITVERLGENDIPVAARVLSHAFLAQPNKIAIWRSQDESARRMHEILFRIYTLPEHNGSRVLAARRENLIAGVLNMAISPHCELSPLETLAHIPEALKLLSLPQMLMLIEGGIFRGPRLLSGWARHHPKKPHWHLGPIGVLPEFQGQGIGSRMLRRCLEIIDEQKSAAYLETDRAENVTLYERYGFSVIGQEIILGVTNYFMWRPPR